MYASDAVRDGGDAGMGADDRAGAFRGPGVGVRGRLVIGDAVEWGMQSAQHLRAEARLDLAHAVALQVLRRIPRAVCTRARIAAPPMS